MAKRTSLREFQENLVRRLRAAQSEAAPSARLSFEIDGARWLISLSGAGEVLPVPAIESVPLTRDWFLGVANLRGVLYGITDFAAFLGGSATPRTPDNRLLLIGQPYGINAALLVTRLTGLRSVSDFEVVQDEAVDMQWADQAWRDGDGAIWRGLDAARLLGHRDFLDIAAR